MSSEEGEAGTKLRATEHCCLSKDQITGALPSEEGGGGTKLRATEHCRLRKGGPGPNYRLLSIAVRGRGGGTKLRATEHYRPRKGGRDQITSY